MKLKIALIGIGNIGWRFLELLQRKQELLLNHFGLEFSVVAAADSSGGQIQQNGFNLEELIKLKTSGGYIRDTYKSPIDPIEMICATEIDLLVELSPTNLKTGGIGLKAITTALENKISVVTANKGPLVLQFSKLIELAKTNNVGFEYSATVTGGLPTLNIGKRDLSACDIKKFEGIVNSTTDFILTWMSEGKSFEESLQLAKNAGFAEADPSLDIDGWDAANKLVIIANSVLKQPTNLQDIEVTGIRNITLDEVSKAKAANRTIKLVVCAEKIKKDYKFTVKPTWLDINHPLTKLGGNWQGVIYYTDINGNILAAIDATDPYPTAAAVLEDIIELYKVT